MSPEALANKEHVKKMIVDSVNKAIKVQQDNPDSAAALVDYEISVLLDSVENKAVFCKELLVGIKKTKASAQQKEILQKLSLRLLGKLCYFGLQENRFISCSDLPLTVKDTQSAIQVLESSPIEAASFIDAQKDQKYKTFYNGMASYLYQE